MTNDLLERPEEVLRLQNMLCYEKAAYQEGYCRVAGIDEAGRGPLAGPVVAAVCILPAECVIAQIDDSKKLKPQLRAQLYELLTTDPSILFAVGIIDSETIDRINIYQATMQAMYRAVDQLAFSPDYLLVDGMQLHHPTIPSLKIIKGDQLSLSIAAASIIAKETRDRLMKAYHQRWPHYGFDQHKGYGTPQHLSALTAHGPCPIHRFSFAPVSEKGSKRRDGASG